MLSQEKNISRYPKASRLGVYEAHREMKWWMTDNSALIPYACAHELTGR